MTTSTPLAQHAAVQSQIDLLDIWIKAQMAYEQLPGIAVAIVYEQEVVYAQGFGQGISAENSIFRIASHSKLFTAIAILQLRDSGGLNLDDPVTKHLPWFNLQTADVGSPAITIRHLLTHTAGAPREAGSGYWIDLDFPTVDQVRERLGNLKAPIPTENRFKYSNLAYGILGYIIEAVSGYSYADFVSTCILEPLGMSSTSVIFPNAHKERLVTGHGNRMPDGTRSTLPFIDARGLASATGMSSTVHDMARFLQWQFRCRDDKDGSIMRGSTLREMQRAHWVEPSWKSAQGLGFSLSHIASTTFVGHGGAYPGYLTYSCIAPSSKMGVSVFANSLDAEPQTIAGKILQWFTPAVHQAQAGVGEPEVDEKWRNLTGTYRTHWGDTHVLIRNGKLTRISPRLDNPLSYPFTLEPNDDDTFTLQGSFGGRAVGERVRFELNDAGQATRAQFGDNWMERVEYDIATAP